MILFYNIVIAMYSFVVRSLSWMGHSKARQWTLGRKNIWQELEQSDIASSPHEIIWFHFASLGEYEQGRPVMEQLKWKDSSTKIVATFFSPSGYEFCKETQLIDYKFYLPIDTAANAQKFIQLIAPKKAFFVKYEFWHHYLSVLKQRRIKTYLVSGLFRENQVFFKWYGALYRKMLQCFDAFFLQNETSKALIEKYVSKPIIVSGDTRFDRCIQIAETPYQNETIENFIANDFCMIAGSTWKEDEELLKNIRTEIKLIIAPHDIKRAKEIYEQFENSCYYSDYQIGKNILIIDNIGMLSKIYKYASIAYVGGAFGNGLHNIIEPLSHGKPVIFGPNTDKFPEAQVAIQHQVGHQVQSSAAFLTIVEQYYQHADVLQEDQNKAKDFSKSHQGAAKKIVDSIYSFSI